ncbi:MAG: hypothetical protein ACJ8C4_10390 [Gemmataceae bacterium]
MYGVPADLPIQRFVGDHLAQVRIGMDGIHFAFGNTGSISAYGTWELRDRSGNLIDCYQDQLERESYRVHVIFNETVTVVSIDPPQSFSFDFASGHRLTVFDDGPEYESIMIMPDEIVI